MRTLTWVFATSLICLTPTACQRAEPQWSAAKTTRASRIERLDPSLDNIVPPSALIEKVADGFEYAEGPLWIRGGDYLLFTDNNLPVVHKWSPQGGVSTYIRGGDLDRTNPSIGGIPGAEALTLDPQGRLYIADDSHRRVAQIEDGKLVTIADRYQGKRLNSPNDVIFRSDGAMYFTDPTDGLEKVDADPHRELGFAGVYRLTPPVAPQEQGPREPQLLSRELPHPNGIALSPDERFLYVSNADEVRKIWMRWELTPDGLLGPGSIFYDASNSDGEGVPDGMKVDKRGDIFAAGPGGVWIISPAGKPLGRIRLPEPPSNCAWGGDGKTLYITAQHALYRIRLSVEGIVPGEQ